MYNIRSPISIFFSFILLALTACGSGSNSTNVSDNNPGDNNPSIVIESLPGSEFIDPPWRMKAADDGHIYISTNNALLEISKQGGVKRTVAGNQHVHDGSTWVRHTYRRPTISDIDGNYLYAYDNHGNVFRVYKDNDNLESIDIFLYATGYHGILEGAFNSLNIFGNSDNLFYLTGYGISKKSYNTIDLPERIIEYLVGTHEVQATDNSLYIERWLPSEHSLYRYDLSSKQLAVQITDMGGDPSSRMTLSDSTFYWMKGSSLYSMNISSNSPQLIANIPEDDDRVRQVIADSRYIYVCTYHLYSNGLDKIYKVSISSGIVELIYTSPYITSMATHNGRLYFSTAMPYIRLNTFSDAWEPIELFHSQGTTLQGRLVYDIQLISGKNNIYLIGKQILIYNVSTGTYEIIYPVISRPDSLFESGGHLYAASHNGCGGVACIVSIPVDKGIRQPEIFNQPVTSYSSVMSAAKDREYMYWIWKSAENGQFIYRLSKASLNGLVNEMLFESNDELRDIAIHDGKLFFACNNACGGQGWVLASLPITGGQPTPIFGPLNDPRVYYKGNIFYVGDTSNFIDRNLFAVDVDRKEYVELLTGLYYQHDLYDDIFIDRSDKWLYVGQYKSSGMPHMKISRFKILDWDNIGPEEIVAYSAGGGLRTGTLTTDGSHLYYYHNGEIKKVAE